MTKRPSLFLFCSLIFSFTLNAANAEETCPKLENINRNPGEYSWETSTPGWEGAFISPTNGKGYSYQVESFLSARWIQFSNLPTSPGYIQCDYRGNNNNELIRFTQTGNKATKHPYGDYWVQVKGNYQFPSVQAECSVSLDLCKFEQL